MNIQNLNFIMQIVSTVYDPESQAGIKLKHGEKFIVLLWSTHKHKIMFY